jgi:hypothetical protein
VSFLRTRKTPHYLRKLRSASGSTDNHATSGLKFKILVDFLSVGINVLSTRHTSAPPLLL